MKRTLLFLVFPVMVSAQYIHSFQYFNFDYSANRLEYFPVGNVGFDTKLNPYNPDIINNNAHIFANVSAFTNLNQTVYGNGQKRFIEDRKVYPNFIIQYQNNWYAIQLSYISSMVSSVEGINQFWLFYFGQTLETNELFIPALNSTLQISSVFKLSDQFNASIGVITNNFETQFVFPGQGFLKYKRNFFDNIQINLALNFNYDNFIRCYLLARTESSDKKLKIEHSLVSNQFMIFNYPDVFFNGLVGAGIKINVLENLGLSLESKNDFINYKSKSIYYNSNPGGQFNARILSGINYKPVDFAQIGLLYSKYITYINPLFPGDPPAEFTTLPYSIIFGASISYKMLDFNLQYQYSGYEISSIYGYSEKSQNHYLGFGIGVKL